MSLRFNTTRPSETSYRNFIDSLRRTVKSGFEAQGIAVLRSRPSVSNNDRFIEVELTNSQRKTIRVAIDVINLSVVGYAFENQCWFLRDNTYPPNAPPGSSVFRDIGRNQRHVLNFGGKYVGAHQLESFAGNRRNIDLGVSMLEEAIGFLSDGGQIDDGERARFFLIITQMITEAAKFRYVEDLVVNSILENGVFVPDTRMINLENNWETLSEQIQRDGGANLPSQIQTQDSRGNTTNSGSSSFNVSDLAVIKYYGGDE